MGTNYYMLTNRCDCCGRADRLHVGKSSMGWRMTLRRYRPPREDPGPTSWAEWQEALANADGIVDEYDRPVPLSDFMQRVESKAEGQRAADAHIDGPVDLYDWEFS